MRITILFLLALGAASPGRADQITLKNGDRITGEIVKKDAKTITLKSPVLGTVTAPWDQVAAIRSDAPLTVELPGGKNVQATLETSGGLVELKETRQTLPPAQIVGIRNATEQRKYERLLHPGWTELWTGTVAVGFAGTQGNAQTRTFTTAVNADRLTNADKTSLYFKSIKASATAAGIEAETAEAVRGGWSYNRNILSRLFVNTFNDYEYDRFQNLDLRFVIGGGLGYEIWKAERGRLSAVAGAAYNHEKFSPVSPLPEFTRQSAEAYWGEDWNWALTGRTSLVQGFRMFNNLSDTGEMRINADLAAVTTLRKWLTWNIGLSDRYLSNPVAGRKTNDFLYTTGIGVTFSH